MCSDDGKNDIQNLAVEIKSSFSSFVSMVLAMENRTAAENLQGNRLLTPALSSFEEEREKMAPAARKFVFGPIVVGEELE